MARSATKVAFKALKNIIKVLPSASQDASQDAIAAHLAVAQTKEWNVC